MKKTFLFLLLLSITLGTQAQLLWKISGKGLPEASYIFGTHHLAKLSIIDSISQFKQVMADTKQVYGEIVMDDMMQPDVMAKMQQEMVFGGDSTLRSLYTEEQYDTISTAIKKFIGVDISMLEKMKPAAISMQLAVIMSMKVVDGYNPQEQLDTWFQQQAKKAGKKVGGLETVDDQMHVLFHTQNMERQAEMLYCSLTNLDFNLEIAKEMADAYLHQKVEHLYDLINVKFGNSCDSRPEELEALIYHRNSNWVKLMPSLMLGNPTLFVVGCGHLAGEKGVLALLKEQGYDVEPVK